MSKDRKRARAARERAAAQEAAAAREASARRPQRRAASPSRPKAPAPAKPAARQRVYRLRRFPPLPWRLKAALALGWLVAAAAIVYLVPTWSGRLGLLVVATAALPLIVVLVRDPSRRTR